MRNPDTYQFEQSYDMVTCFGTLHFLAKSEWKWFIDNAKQNTNIGGIHIIQIFTDTVLASEDIAPFKSYIFEDEHPNVPKHLHASNKIVARKVK